MPCLLSFVCCAPLQVQLLKGKLSSGRWQQAFPSSGAGIGLATSTSMAGISRPESTTPLAGLGTMQQVQCLPCALLGRISFHFISFQAFEARALRACCLVVLSCRCRSRDAREVGHEVLWSRGDGGWMWHGVAGARRKPLGP